MEYHSMDWSDDLEIIGHHPQTKLKKGYNPGPPNGFWEVHPDKFPDFVPNLELELHEKAIPTNYLDTSQVSFGVIVDGKLKRILESHVLPDYHFYPIKVYHKGSPLEYYWFHYIIDIWKYVNMEASSAQIYKKFDFEIEKIIPVPDLSTVREFEESLDFGLELRINKLVFKAGYPNYDVVRIVDVQFEPRLFSSRLVNTLKKQGITGFEIKLFDKIVQGKPLGDEV